MSKPLPKSLHTVTVLVRFASYTLEEGFAITPEDAVDHALATLGLSDKPDEHGLREAALKQLA